MDTSNQTGFGEARWQCSALTDTGRKRAQNEDAILALPEHGVFGVADGMGGARHGALASRTVIDAVRRRLEDSGRTEQTASSRRLPAVRDAMVHANREIFDLASRTHSPGMGSTTVMLVIEDEVPLRGTILNVGDSRAYRFRDGSLEQLTKDHSLAAEAGLPNRAALPAAFRNIITRAVGIALDLEIDAVTIDIRPDDVLLLCSDGLYGMVPDSDLGRIIAEEGRHTTDQLASRLVHRANLNGGADNISVVVIRFPDPSAEDGETEPITLERVLPAIPGERGEDDTARLSSGTVSRSEPVATGRRRAVQIAVMVAAAAALGGWGGLMIGGRSPDSSVVEHSRPVPEPADAVVNVPTNGGGAVAACAMEEGSQALTAEIQDLRTQVTNMQARLFAHNRCQGRAIIARDIQKTLINGQWGALGVRIEKWQTCDPAFMDDVSGSALYTLWHHEWQRVASGALNPSNEYARLCRQARRILPEASVSGAGIEPRWGPDATTNATLYCRHRYSLEQRILHAVCTADGLPQQE
jgi:serine/threonine protein phosphatase PrpC